MYSELPKSWGNGIFTRNTCEGIYTSMYGMYVTSILMYDVMLFNFVLPQGPPGKETFQGFPLLKSRMRFLFFFF